jgi:hypothetical protein
MNDELNKETRLWEYVDGLGTPAERAEWDRVIQSDEYWRGKLQEFMELKKILGESGLEEPSMRFTRNVMEEIGKYQVAAATRNYLDKKIIWGIGGAFLVTIAGLVIYMLSRVRLMDGETPGFVNRYSDSVKSFGWIRYFNGTTLEVIMLVNIMLALLLLDGFLRNRLRSEKEG